MKKRILFIIDHLGIGGVQEFILNYIKVLTEHEVTVLSLFGADVYSDKIKQAGGITIFLSELEYNYLNIITFKTFYPFKRYIQQHIQDFDGVHIKLFAAFWYSSLLGLYRYRFVSAGLDASKYQLPLPLRFLYRIYANRYYRFYLTKYYWDEYDYIRPEILINQQYFITLRQSAKPIAYPHEFVLLSIGRCIKQKGFQDVIELFKIIQDSSGFDIGLYIIGEGPYENSLATLVKENKIPNVYFTGNVLNLDDYIESANMIIKMSQQEGVNSVVREALVSGKWVATTIETDECQKLADNDLIITLDRDDLLKSAINIIAQLKHPSLGKDDLAKKARMIWSDREIIEAYRIS